MSTHLESGSVTRTVSDHAADLTVAGVADYVVVNVSSPNTRGLARPAGHRAAQAGVHARRAGPPGPGRRALVDQACLGERQRLH